MYNTQHVKIKIIKIKIVKIIKCFITKKQEYF